MLTLLAWLPLLLLPNFVAVLCEALGWWLCHDRLGQRPRFRGLVTVRVIGDALTPRTAEEAVLEGLKVGVAL